MPYLNIQTNNELGAGKRAEVMSALSAAVAEQLGKSERYVMVALQSSAPMLFGGGDAPTAYVELKSIGLPGSETPHLARALCEVVHQELAIPPERVYIEFTDVARHMWGWNGGTF